MLPALSKTASSTPSTISRRGILRRAFATCAQPRYLLTLLVLLGAAARLRQYFARTSYWHDEAFLLLNIFEKSSAQLVGPLSHDQAAPPAFLWLLRACYLAAGPSELVMRLPALLASLAALALMVPLARTVVGKTGSLWAVGCACVSSCLLHLTYQVKPYTTDVLVAEVVLWATAVYLQAGGAKRGKGDGYVLGAAPCGPFRQNAPVPFSPRRTSGLGLLMAALVGPWLSFPSVFVLAGTAVALLFDAARRGGRRAWAFWIGMQGALLASCGTLWLAAARHHNTAYQQAFWAADFVDVSSMSACLAWFVRKLVEAGNYGVQGTGLPVAVLASIGFTACVRREPKLAIALAAPAGLACLAAALRHYPLGNRLLAFLLPCLWLTAGYGLDVLSRVSERRAAWVVPGLAALLLLAGGTRTVLYAVVAKPSVEFRQAFEYVHRRWSAGDSLWVSQPAVYEVYFGRRPNVIDAESPRDKIERAAQDGRVWMVCHPPAAETSRWDSAREAIESSGAIEVDRRRFVHLDVGVFSPPADVTIAQNKPVLP